MVYKLLTLTFILCCSQRVLSQQSNYFLISDPLHADASLLVENTIATSDSGSLVIGTIEWSSSNSGDGFVVKVDSSGNIQWTKRYAYNDTLQLFSAFQSDSNFYIGGVTSAGSLLMEIDKNGNVLWGKSIICDGSRIIGFNRFKDYVLVNCTGFLFKMDSLSNLTAFSAYEKSFGDTVKNLLVDSNSIYLIGSYYYNYCMEKSWLLKKNSFGEVVWVKDKIKVQGSAVTSATSGFVNSDHSITILMDCDNQFCYDGKKVFARFDSDGNFISAKSFVTNGYEEYQTNSFSVGENKTVLACDVSQQDDSSCVILSIDENEELLWAKWFTNTPNGDFPMSLVKANSNLITIGGVRNLSGSCFIMNLNSDGSGCNSFNFPVSTAGKTLDIDDETYQAIGDTSHTITSIDITQSDDLNVLKLCGFPTAANPSITPNEKTLVYPNPFSESFTIDLPDRSDFQMIITDELGQVVVASGIRSHFQGGQNLPPGIYIMQLSNDSGTILTTKLLKTE